MSASAAAASSSSSQKELKKTKNINGEESVASSLNSVVKKQFTNMTEQYNLYASTINKMEEKIKELKNIMLSECFLQHCQNFTMEIPKHAETNANTNTKKTNKHNSIESDKNIIIASSGEDGNTKVDVDVDVDSVKLEYFTPSQSNSLFWCFYIIYNGFASYEYESNYFTAEQQFKIQTIEKVKKGEGKAALKEHKISKTCFEGGLLGCTNINAKTLYALCLCYNLNIFYIYKNTYYEMISDIKKPVHIVKYNAETNNYSICLPVDTSATETFSKHSEYIEKIKETYWKLDSLEKPLRPITVYSVHDLTTICSKLEIDVDFICETTKKNKKKTKAQLYADIMHKL
jgi:uncharacterized protein YajQ (UPF0234 family)